MKISAAIMAHESRAHRIDYLLDTLGECPVFMDYGKIGEPGNLGPWGNAKRAWRAYNPDATFHMVVQDDVVFGKRFIERLIGLVSKYGPEYAYCLFANLNGHCIDEDFKSQMRKPVGIVTHRELYWGQTVLLPTWTINEMIPFADSCQYDRGRGTWIDDDARISEYLKSIRMKVIYPIPSLVTQNKKMDSLVGYGHNRGRQARYFV